MVEFKSVSVHSLFMAVSLGCIRKQEREIEEMRRRLYLLDSETGISQYSAGKIDQSMDTVYFKNIRFKITI